MSGCQPYHGRSWKPGSSAILGNLRHRLMDMPDSELLVDTARMRGLRTQAAAEQCALRAQIAADDFSGVDLVRGGTNCKWSHMPLGRGGRPDMREMSPSRILLEKKMMGPPLAARSAPSRRPLHNRWWA